ncbi:MAG: hypothetical protein PHE27_03555 [Alphaproteobacteria bacterium]|nr:hypothetical protein [Alphaproteobacteria bacterium]
METLSQASSEEIIPYLLGDWKDLNLKELSRLAPEGKKEQPVTLFSFNRFDPSSFAVVNERAVGGNTKAYELEELQAQGLSRTEKLAPVHAARLLRERVPQAGDVVGINVHYKNGSKQKERTVWFAAAEENVLTRTQAMDAASKMLIWKNVLPAAEREKAERFVNVVRENPEAACYVVHIKESGYKTPGVEALFPVAPSDRVVDRATGETYYAKGKFHEPQFTIG